jgi:glycosyltransferase involved in cell wall biosynthesis
MCGIADLLERPGIRADQVRLHAMTDSLRHRGPDASGSSLTQPDISNAHFSSLVPRGYYDVVSELSPQLKHSLPQEHKDDRRIAIIATSLGEGGAERVTHNLITHLSKTTKQLSVCLLRGPVHYVPPSNVPITILHKNKPWHIPRTLTRLRQFIINTEPSIVLTTATNANIMYFLATQRFKRKPRWIARVGNVLSNEPTWQRILAPRAYTHADYLVANSYGLARAISASIPVLSSRCRVVPNPVDFEAIDCLSQRASLDIRPELPIVLSVGRLVPQKRPDLLLDAFALVARRTPCVLWLSGTGPLSSRLERQSERLGIQDRVTFWGFQPNPYPLMKAASVFVMTSAYEGCPNSLIEAQGLGIPAVATDCDFGPREIIHNGLSGFLTPPGDADAIAASIHTLLMDPTRMRNMTTAAHRLTRDTFDVSHTLPLWDTLITEALR